MNLSVILISNPAAKKASAKKIAAASYYLQSKGCSVEVLFTGKRGDAAVLARETINKSPSLIIAAGGDGTINEIANGIAGSEIPMAILPLGTVNVLARELGIPEDIKGALKIALTGTPRPVTLGKILCSHLSTSVSRYFVLMAGIGYDADSVFCISETVKKFSGKSAYILGGIQALTRFSPNELTVSVDGNKFSGYSAIIGNVSKYGGNFRVTPDARITDPFLYICLFKGKKRIDLLRYVSGIITGRHLRFRDIEYLRAESVEITGNAHVQIDGDYLGMTPAKIEVVRDALRLVF